jgi:selT/selW/selH-like putative selenoprotein
LAASIESRFGEKVEIKPGSRGQFDVIVGDQLIFSKHDTGRFPEPDEVEQRFSLLKEGKDLPPAQPAERGWFVSKLLSKLTG